MTTKQESKTDEDDVIDFHELVKRLNQKMSDDSANTELKEAAQKILSDPSPENIANFKNEIIK